MNLVTGPNSILLWQDIVKHAEDQCAIRLKHDLEAYLVTLLMRYTNKPEVMRQVVATAFLEALQVKARQRQILLQHVGDQCLIFVGLFPHIAEKRHVKMKYFVDLGRSAYANISASAHDLFWSLSYQFVGLMDVLQSIRYASDLMPLEAYEQWEDLGSKRALRFLMEYSRGIPITNINRTR